MSQHAFSNLSSAKTFANERRAEGRTCRITKSIQTIVGCGRVQTVSTFTKFMVHVN